MKLKFLIFAILLSAMGPARVESPPAASEATEPAAHPQSPEDVASPPAPKAERAQLPEREASGAVPDDFIWKSRLVLVFADTPDDPAFIRQMQSLRNRPEMLIERDVVVITDSSLRSGSIWRQNLHPQGFSLVIIGKDGQVKLRKPLPWDVREISRAIDKFPLRRQEIGRAGAAP